MRVCISRADIVAESVLKKSEKNVISFNFLPAFCLWQTPVLRKDVCSPLPSGTGGEENVTSYMGDGTYLSDFPEYFLTHTCLPHGIAREERL